MEMKEKNNYTDKCSANIKIAPVNQIINILHDNIKSAGCGMAKIGDRLATMSALEFLARVVFLLSSFQRENRCH